METKGRGGATNNKLGETLETTAAPPPPTATPLPPLVPLPPTPPLAPPD